MTNEQLQRIKHLLRAACGADWAEADTLFQAVERLADQPAATETATELIRQANVLLARAKLAPEADETAARGTPAPFKMPRNECDCEACPSSRPSP